MENTASAQELNTWGEEMLEKLRTEYEARGSLPSRITLDTTAGGLAEAKAIVLEKLIIETGWKTEIYFVRNPIFT